jgi:predicted kinase
VKKLILVCGPAGIGKSTFCRDYIRAHCDEIVKIVSSDEVRREICGSYQKFPPNKNMLPIYDGMLEEARRYYDDNSNVTIIFDTTMLYDERRLFFVNNLPKFDETDLYLLKLHDYSICLQRNKMRRRDKWVPDEVILDMIKHYMDPTPETAKHFTKVETFYLDQTNQ